VKLRRLRLADRGRARCHQQRAELLLGGTQVHPIAHPGEPRERDVEHDAGDHKDNHHLGDRDAAPRAKPARRCGWYVRMGRADARLGWGVFLNE